MIIYSLEDPRNNEIRYVGITSQTLSKRYNQHIDIGTLIKESSYKAKWILSLRHLGLRPTISVLEENVAEKDWSDREKFWISYCKSIGCDLTNLTEGGNITKQTEESNRKRSESLKEHYSQPGVYKPGLGKHPSKETVEKMRLSMLGKNHTLESRKKMSEVARKLTDEQRIEIKEKHRKGYTQKQLAEEYNVDQTTISNVIWNKSRLNKPSKIAIEEPVK